MDKKKKIFEHPYAYGKPPSVEMPDRLPMLEEFIKGGVGQDIDPGDVDPLELEIGKRVETEHVSRRAEILQQDIDDETKQAIAQEIALDHLAEPDNEDYYYKLYVSGIADEDISDILSKWEGDSRVEDIRNALSEKNEDFQDHFNQVIQDMGADPEATGFDYDTVNSGVIHSVANPQLVIRNIVFDPEMYETPEDAAIAIGSAIQGELVFDPAEGELKGNDAYFPLKTGAKPPAEEA